VKIAAFVVSGLLVGIGPLWVVNGPEDFLAVDIVSGVLVVISWRLILLRDTSDPARCSTDSTQSCSLFLPTEANAVPEI